MKKCLVPSLLSANFFNLESDISVLKKCKIKYIHIDVMDAQFVPNLSMGMPIIKSINDYVGADFTFDTHLMICKPERYIEDFKKVGADILTVHYEATADIIKTLNVIKEYGMLAGVSIIPETDVRVLHEVLPIADLVLVMSVHPGFGGQKFIENSLEKVKYLDELRKKNSYKYIIEIDGGVDKNNIKRILEEGVDFAVAGSAVFKDDIETNINDFNKIIEAYNE